MTLLRLFQLADAAFPAGGFAFSNGLESLAKLGFVKSVTDFEEYLDCHLDQMTSGDLPFLNSVFQIGNPFLGEDLRQLHQEWDAWIFLPTQRKASLSQGQAWARSLSETFSALEPGSESDAYKNLEISLAWFKEQNLPSHFLMIFSVSLKLLGYSLQETQNIFLHFAMRDQVGAAVRLGLIGSLQAQKIQQKLILISEKYLSERSNWDFNQAYRAFPMIDLAQANHTNLYSKLFQS